MNKKFVGGCCGILALILVGLVVFAFVSMPRILRKGTTWATAHIEEVKSLVSDENAWRPPSAAPDASWFPAKVETWTLSTNEEIVGIPELRLDRAGHRGKYRGDTQDVEVTIVPASELERDGIFTRAKAALESGGTHVMSKSGDGFSIHAETHSSRMTTQTPNRLSVSLNGTEHTRLWWLKGWLFIFHTSGKENPDAFVEKYLEATTPPELEKR